MKHPTRRGTEGNSAFVMTPLAAAMVAALSPATPTIAKDDEALEEIIVTATRREMSLQDVGQSIVALTTADIERQSLQRMEDSIRTLPSVGLISFIPGGRNSITIRGISDGPSEVYTNSQVAVYLDEQPISTIAQQVDIRMIDIARIEALPGPQGTLFGSSSQTGTLRIITNQPNPDRLSGQIDAGISSTSGGEISHDLSGHVNIPLIEDKLAIRAVAFTSHEGGYVDNVLGATLEGSEENTNVAEENQNEFDSYGGRIAARWTINENWELDTSYIAQKSEAAGTWVSDPALGDFKITTFFKEFRDDDWYQASATIRGDLGFAELTATASYFDRDIAYAWDSMVYDQWAAAYWGGYYDLYNRDYTFGTIFNDQDSTRSAHEVRLVSQGESRLQWIIGGFYEDLLDSWFFGGNNPDYVGTTSWYAAQAYAYYYNTLGYDVQYPLPGTTISFSEDYDNTIKHTAVFGEISYDLTDRWSATFGARWFEYDRDTVLIYQLPQGLPPFGAFDTNGRTDASGADRDTVYKLGTQFQVNDDVMVYGLYSEGFRLGGHNSQRAAATGLVPLIYEADSVENYEIGLKGRFADDRVLLNVTAFSMIWDQIQVNTGGVADQWWLRGTINGGKGESRGVELFSTWQPTDNLKIEALAFLGGAEHSEEFDRIDVIVPAGAPMPGSPDRKYKFAVDYTITDVLGGHLWFRYDYMYEGMKWNDLGNIVASDPDGISPSWSLSNILVGLTIDNGWEFTLTAKNVWNQKALNGLSNDPADSLKVTFDDPRWDILRNYAKPRTIGLNIRKRF